jgi:hypothetical protein
MPISSVPISSQLSSFPEGSLERLDLSVKSVVVVNLDVNRNKTSSLNAKINKVIVLSVTLLGDE